MRLNERRTESQFSKTAHLLFEQQGAFLDIADAFSDLTWAEEMVIRLRCGLWDSNQAYTLEEIARLFTLTRERIRQIEAKAFRRLRTSANQENIKVLMKYKIAHKLIEKTLGTKVMEVESDA